MWGTYRENTFMHMMSTYTFCKPVYREMNFLLYLSHSNPQKDWEVEAIEHMESRDWRQSLTIFEPQFSYL